MKFFNYHKILKTAVFIVLCFCFILSNLTAQDLKSLVTIKKRNEAAYVLNSATSTVVVKVRCEVRDFTQYKFHALKEYTVSPSEEVFVGEIGTFDNYRYIIAEVRNTSVEEQRLAIEKERLGLEREKAERERNIELEKAQRAREEAERIQIEAEAKEKREREEAEERKIAEDIKRVKEEDKAVNGANTRLKMGLISGNFEMVKKAIAEKANPAAVFEKGENTLFFALNNAKILNFLIENGADVTQKRDDGASPLHLVENVEVAISLVKYTRDINAPDKNKQTPLESAIRRNKPDIAIYLIDKGADVNSNRGAPLSFACGMNKVPVQLEVVITLIGKGAKINQAPDNANYPLHLAAQGDNYDLAKLLLEKGANPDLKDGANKKVKYYAQDKRLKALLKD